MLTVLSGNAMIGHHIPSTLTVTKQIWQQKCQYTTTSDRITIQTLPYFTGVFRVLFLQVKFVRLYCNAFCNAYDRSRSLFGEKKKNKEWKERVEEGTVSDKINATIRMNPDVLIYACTDLQQRHPKKHRIWLSL